MATISTATGVIAGTASVPLQVAGAPSAGTSAVDTITIGGTPTGGSFTLTFQGFTTAAIAWSSTNATLLSNVDTALEALPSGSAGAGGSFTCAAGTLTAGIGTITVTYTGNLAVLAIPAPIGVGANSMTGTAPTIAVANTTPGVTATGRGQGKGALLVDVTNAITYQNTGSATSPTWSKVGLET